jgi:hypothetical protein
MTEGERVIIPAASIQLSSTGRGGCGLSEYFLDIWSQFGYKSGKLLIYTKLKRSCRG